MPCLGQTPRLPAQNKELSWKRSVVWQGGRVAGANKCVKTPIHNPMNKCLECKPCAGCSSASTRALNTVEGLCWCLQHPIQFSLAVQTPTQRHQRLIHTRRCRSYVSNAQDQMIRHDLRVHCERAVVCTFVFNPNSSSSVQRAACTVCTVCSVQ